MPHFDDLQKMKNIIFTLITALLISSNLNASLYLISISGEIGSQDGSEVGSPISTGDSYNLEIVIDDSIAPTFETSGYDNSITITSASIGSFTLNSTTGSFGISNDIEFFSSDEISLIATEMKNEASGISGARFNYFFASPDTTLSGNGITESLIALSDQNFTIRFEAFEFTYNTTFYLYNLTNPTYEVSAIPEPSCTALLAIVFISSLYIKRKR